MARTKKSKKKLLPIKNTSESNKKNKVSNSLDEYYISAQKYFLQPEFYKEFPFLKKNINKQDNPKKQIYVPDNLNLLATYCLFFL